MHDLVRRIFVTTFDDPELERGHDGAVLPAPTGRIAFTTDSYVVSPLVFPGGDIGSLAVHGTVNDLAMCGARPSYLSAGFILEEGFPMASLEELARSMQRAASGVGVRVVTGDTKVVERGSGDGVYINTAGVGFIEHDRRIGPEEVRPGDAIVLSGDIGRHGIAILGVREGLAFETPIESDSAPVVAAVMALLADGVEVRCLRDLTRGGLASALVEIAETSGRALHLEETAVPVAPEVRGACEVLGLDPMHVANEGRFVTFVPEPDVDRALAAMREHAPPGVDPVRIGTVLESGRAGVTMTSRIGTRRIVDMFSGEQLPRIC